jgi:hypothetical protein
MSIGDNSVPVNAYNFSEKTGDLQPYITNSLGRTVLFAEFIYQNGFFGNVTDQDGIENGSSGYIDINAERIVTTQQIEATDTFTVGNTLWFVSGGSGAAGKFVDADPGSGTRLAVGIITAKEGTAGAQTSVSFRPFVQRLDAADVSAQVSVLQAEMLVEQAEPKTIVQKITADASAGIAVTGLSEGDEVIGMSVICTTANASGTLVLEDGAGDDITDGVACAVDGAVDYAASIDDAKSTIPASGAKLISVGGTAANTRGIAVINYIPA